MIRVTYMVDAPYVGGAERYVARLATGLDPAEFATSVVVRSGGEALSQWTGELEAAGVACRRAPMRLPFRPWDAVEIRRVLVSLRPHVVHVNMPGPYSGQTGLLAPIARATGARVVVTEHLPMVERLWKRALVKRAVIGFVDVAVTMTRANAELLVHRQGYPRRRVRVIPNGIPRDYGSRAEDRRALGLHDRDVAFVFVGNLLPHKGLLSAIEAFSRTTVLPWRLLVVGDGPDEAAARGLASRRAVSERVTFLGGRTPQAVEGVVAACDALVLPSSVEGLPYVILEAMACAKPVVSTRVYGIPEAVVDGETGFLVEPGDIPALSHALQTLMQDQSLRESMGRAGRARFEERFTLERHLAAMSSLYREVVTGRGERDG